MRSINSSRGSSRRQDSSYDDSELVSQLWLEDKKRHETESEIDMSGDEHHNQIMPSSSFQQSVNPNALMQPGFIFSQCIHPGLIGPHGPCPRCVPRHFYMPPLQLSYPPSEQGILPLQQQSIPAQLWMEQVNQGSIKKSKAMYMSVLPENFKPPEEVLQSVPHNPSKDDTLPPQWIMARGRGAKSHQDPNYDGDETSSVNADKDENNKETFSDNKQMLLFFQIGGNWIELAWILFEGILNESEMVRMVEDIKLKHPNQLQEQVQDMMHRWWKRKGSAATIEELQRALKITGMAYIKDELDGRNSRLASAIQSDSDLDVGAISDADPEVNRLAQEFLGNTAFDSSFDYDSAAESSNYKFVNTDKIMSKLQNKGLLSSSNRSMGESNLRRSQESLSDEESTVPLTGGQLSVKNEPVKFIEVSSTFI